MTKIIEVKTTSKKKQTLRDALEANKKKYSKELGMVGEDWGDVLNAAFSGFAGMAEGGHFVCDLDFLKESPPNLIRVFCDILDISEEEIEEELGHDKVVVIGAALLRAFELGATIMAIRANYKFDGPIEDSEVKVQTKKNDF